MSKKAKARDCPFLSGTNGHYRRCELGVGHGGLHRHANAYWGDDSPGSATIGRDHMERDEKDRSKAMKSLAYLLSHGYTILILYDGECPYPFSIEIASKYHSMDNGGDDPEELLGDAEQWAREFRDEHGDNWPPEPHVYPLSEYAKDRSKTK